MSVPFKNGHLEVKLVRIPYIVRIKKRYPIAACGLDPPVSGSSRTRVILANQSEA